MKVLDLQCAHAHVFEGWFSGEDDFRAQLESGMLQCPVCNNAQIHKKPSAPRLRLDRGTSQASSGTAPEDESAHQALALRAIRRLIQECEDVGSHFADEARSMHGGESQQRNIRGHASPDEMRALHDEGIEFFAVPDIFKKTLQ